MKARAGWRDALSALVLVLVSIGVALAVAELALRIFAWAAPPAAPPPEDPEVAALPELGGVLELARPNVRGRHSGALWRTNSAGFRGPEVSSTPRPGVFRIAVVGDSFAAGMGVAEEDAYAAQLERRLRAAGTAVEFEVLNFGIGGLDIRQVLRRASRLGARLQPHLYVYGFTLNDIFEADDAEQRVQPAQHRELEEQMLRFAASPSHLLRAIGPRWLSLRQALWPGADDYGGALARAYRDPARFARIESGLGEFAALAERTGRCVHVLIHTELAHLRFAHPYREAYAQVERAARERGLSVTPSFPAYRWRDSSELRLSAIDGHPNAEGHRILADALYAGLRELPPHCGFPPLP
jgi:lysophospholipase L1-like esterase